MSRFPVAGTAVRDRAGSANGFSGWPRDSFEVESAGILTEDMAEIVQRLRHSCMRVVPEQFGFSVRANRFGCVVIGVRVEAPLKLRCRHLRLDTGGPERGQGRVDPETQAPKDLMEARSKPQRQPFPGTPVPDTSQCRGNR